MSVQVKYYCKCGSAIDYTVPDMTTAENILALFKSHHQGKGHGETSAKKAREARNKAEAEYQRGME